jgi:hypothetical protein
MLAEHTTLPMSPGEPCAAQLLNINKHCCMQPVACTAPVLLGTLCMSDMITVLWHNADDHDLQMMAEPATHDG